MQRTTARLLANSLLLLGMLACADERAVRPQTAQLEEGEALSGGDTTNRLLLGTASFTREAANLSSEHEPAFFTGNSFFNESWVEAVSSTSARDGLGPTFNARSCSGCHFKDGRGRPPGADRTGLGLLLRISVPGDGPHGAPLGDAVYGDQLQDRSIPNVQPEATIAIEHDAIEGEYADGERYELQAPRYTLSDPRFGELPEDLMISPRVAPVVVGMGLIEAIPEARLKALADPDDDDGDGISGRINRVYDVQADAMRPGRFGWKAEQPTVLQQSAGAFNGDMGITSRLFPDENCPDAQTDCAAAPHGGERDGDPDVSDERLDNVALYASTLGVPVRRGADDAVVLQGKQLFADAGCVDCHTPRHVTGDAELEELAQQTIWPYTDLLLHDMGEALSDHRPSFAAEGNEWRTPPLWGIGLVETVNDHLLLMHDGRARGFAEAILWHGGEAEASADAFKAMSADERATLVRFLESL